MNWIKCEQQDWKMNLNASCLYTDGKNFFVLRPTQLLNELRTDEYGPFKPTHYIRLVDIPLPKADDETVVD